MGAAEKSRRSGFPLFAACVSASSASRIHVMAIDENDAKKVQGQRSVASEIVHAQIGRRQHNRPQAF
jgi:hypothetical protein